MILRRHYKATISSFMASPPHWGDYSRASLPPFTDTPFASNSSTARTYYHDATRREASGNPTIASTAYQRAYSGWSSHNATPVRMHTPNTHSQRAPWPSEADGYTSRLDETERRTPPSSLLRPPSPQLPPRPEIRRTPTPPHPPPRSPSPSYVAQAGEPSALLADPTALRKLLILDLNGSLLIRAAHKRAQGINPYNSAAVHPLRAVHPRPYMGTFRSFAFHPDTKAWLDLMVWSSAQPHSVADMVKNCFGNEKNKLVAVWARDTLGLSEADYSAFYTSLSYYTSIKRCTPF